MATDNEPRSLSGEVSANTLPVVNPVPVPGMAEALRGETDAELIARLPRMTDEQLADTLDSIGFMFDGYYASLANPILDEAVVRLRVRGRSHPTR